MFLQAEGNLEMNGKKRLGGVVVSPQKLWFYQRDTQMGAAIGGSVGGIIGAVIGAAVDKARAKQLHEKLAAMKLLEQEPEFPSFPEELQRRLKGLPTFAVISREQLARVEPAFGRVTFTTHDGQTFVLRGGTKRKKVLEFLREHGYNVPL
jgi:hypothetical protein